MKKTFKYTWKYKISMSSVEEKKLNLKNIAWHDVTQKHTQNLINYKNVMFLLININKITSLHNIKLWHIKS